MPINATGFNGPYPSRGNRDLALVQSSFSVEEQEKIAGSMLRRTREEILQDMIPWLMGSLSLEEHQAMMKLWKRVTTNTMFSEWLKEWWDLEEYNLHKMEKPPEQNVLPSTSFTDPLEIISTYLLKDILKEHERNSERIWENTATLPKESRPGDNTKQSHIRNVDDESKDSKKGEKGSDQLAGPDSTHKENLSKTVHEELKAAIRRVYRDSSLDSRKKSYIIQHLQMTCETFAL